MKYDDLEKTKDLFDIKEDDVPSPIDNIDTEGVSKENLEEDFTLGLSGLDAVGPQKETTQPITTKPKKEKKKKKERKPLTKKQKIIIIISSIILILLIVAVILFFVLKDKKEVEPPKKEEPEVVIEKDNYIYQDGTLIFLDEEENKIGSYTCKNASEELCYVASYSNEDTFLGEKSVYLDEETLVERPSAIYENNYVFIFDNEEDSNNITLYNIEEEKEEGTYLLVKGFSTSNFVILKDTNEKYGAITFSEDGIKDVFDFSYDYLGRINKDANIAVEANDRFYIYNVEGKNLTKGLRYEIKAYNDKYIVTDNRGYDVYSYDGNLIYDDSYDYVELLEDYAILLRDDELFIRDYKGNKYNEVGIKLDSKQYDPLMIYNEDKKHIDTKRAYEVNVSDSVIDVLYEKDGKERTKTIHLQDGIMSSKYNYISYFDGLLYFYEDEDKTELLGTYECSNSNSSDLTNCTIATDSFYSKNGVEEDKSNSVGWIPIYNKRYVFILDTIDLDNPTIVLYDLKTNKALSKYSSVDSGSYTGKKEVTFKDTNATYIMARVKSDGDYGLLRVSDNVSGTIAFDYDSIEKLKDYYVVKTSSGTYQLYSNVGVEITEAYGYPICNYIGTYLLVGKDDEYYVYNFDGKRLRESDGAYKYVLLQDDYYVIIDSSNHLNIHKYKDELYTLAATITVDSTNYKTDFTVTKNQGGFIVTIKSTNTTYTFDSNGLSQVSSGNE